MSPYERRPKDPPKIPKYQKNTAFTRTISKSSCELLPSSLWHESGTQWKLFRNLFRWTFNFEWILSCGFASSDIWAAAEIYHYPNSCRPRFLDVYLVSGKVKRPSNRQFRKSTGVSHGSLRPFSWHQNTVKQAFSVPWSFLRGHSPLISWTSSGGSFIVCPSFLRCFRTPGPIRMRELRRFAWIDSRESFASKHAIL